MNEDLLREIRPLKVTSSTSLNGLAWNYSAILLQCIKRYMHWSGLYFFC